MKVVKISCMLILLFTLYAFSQARAINLCADSSTMQREDLVKESSTHIGSVRAPKSNQEYSRGILTDGFILDHCCCYYGLDPDSGYVAYPCICTDPHFPLDQFLGMHVEIWGYLQQCIEPFIMEFHITGLHVFTSDVGEDMESCSITNFALEQNYPNPFNPVTTIRYAVSGSQIPLHTTLTIYNVMGQKVRTLIDEPKSAGNYEVIWDGKDENGQSVASGIYFYRIRAGDFTATKKMVILK